MIAPPASGPARPSPYLARREALRDTVTGAAGDLLRAAMTVKLALDLDDPRLARRAAREAAALARLLAGLDVGEHLVDVDLPDVADLLEQLYGEPDGDAA